MTFKAYIKDNIVYLSVYAAMMVLIGYLLAVFHVNASLMIMVLSIILIVFITFLIYGYYRKEHFYNELLSNINRLDKAYLVLETLSEPDFLDGKLLCNALYDIDKSMTENVKELELSNKQFREYIEMWIHEVKLPLASLSLRIHNSGKNADKKNLSDIKRIDNYVEQVLYYARSERAEKDYRIMNIPLSKIIREVALKYKDDLLENGIELLIGSGEAKVNTDLKWITFILGQIVNNSIKYKKNNGDSYIRIYADSKRDIVNVDRAADILHMDISDNIRQSSVVQDKKIKDTSYEVKNENEIKQQNALTERNIYLYIEDNGIGIPEEDIGRVFEKSFTGYNGRIRSKSTGMGLYIAKELCGKLGHDISIESVKGEFTRVCIVFHGDDYYNVTKS